MEVSVAEAAEVLGVSVRRVRAMIASGVLPSRLVVGRHVIDSTLLRSARHVTRPMSSRVAWGLVVGVDDADWLTASEKYKLRQRIQNAAHRPDRLDVLASWLARRAAPTRYRCPDAASLLGDERLVPSCTTDLRARINDQDSYFYVQPGDQDAMAYDHMLVPSDTGRVVLRVSPVHLDTPAPLVLVVADLCDDGQPRSIEAAQRLVKEIPLWQ